jgi:hypothetical protein
MFANNTAKRPCQIRDPLLFFDQPTRVNNTDLFGRPDCLSLRDRDTTGYLVDRDLNQPSCRDPVVKTPRNCHQLFQAPRLASLHKFIHYTPIKTIIGMQNTYRASAASLGLGGGKVGRQNAIGYVDVRQILRQPTQALFDCELGIVLPWSPTKRYVLGAIPIRIRTRLIAKAKQIYTSVDPLLA